MRKKNGFTLVELLAVVVILTIIVLIAVPLFNTQTKEAKKTLYREQVSRILTAAKTYEVQHPDKLPSVNDEEAWEYGDTEPKDFDLSTVLTSQMVTKVDLKTLKQEGLLKNEDIKNPMNSKDTLDEYVAIYYNYPNKQYVEVYCESNDDYGHIFYDKYFKNKTQYENEVKAVCGELPDVPTPPNPGPEDPETPTITLGQYTSYTDRITLNYTVKNATSLTIQYREKGASQWIDTSCQLNNSTCTITNLLANVHSFESNNNTEKEYEIKYTAQNNSKNVEKTQIAKTKLVDIPIISINDNNHTITINYKYSTNNILIDDTFKNPNFYFKATDGTSNLEQANCDNDSLTKNQYTLAGIPKSEDSSNLGTLYDLGCSSDAMVEKIRNSRTSELLANATVAGETLYLNHYYYFVPENKGETNFNIIFNSENVNWIKAMTYDRYVNKAYHSIKQKRNPGFENIRPTTGEFINVGTTKWTKENMQFTINYFDYGFNSPSYYFYATPHSNDSITADKTVYYCDENGCNQSITSGNALSNTGWYKVDSNTVTITYDREYEYSFVAKTQDSTSYLTSSLTTSSIDKTNPTITIGTNASTQNTILINYSLDDLLTDRNNLIGSGINDNNTICKCGTNSNNLNKTSTTQSSASCTVSGLSANTTYYCKLFVEDNVGNKAESELVTTKTEAEPAPEMHTVTYYDCNGNASTTQVEHGSYFEYNPSCLYRENSQSQYSEITFLGWSTLSNSWNVDIESGRYKRIQINEDKTLYAVHKTVKTTENCVAPNTTTSGNIYTFQEEGYATQSVSWYGGGVSGDSECEADDIAVNCPACTVNMNRCLTHVPAGSSLTLMNQGSSGIDGGGSYGFSRSFTIYKIYKEIKEQDIYRLNNVNYNVNYPRTTSRGIDTTCRDYVYYIQ